MYQRIDKGAALGMLALQMVILQGLLGGLTVVHRLPLIVSASHLALSLVFFCTIAYITVSLLGEGRPATSVMGPRSKVLVGAAVVYVQCILGALVRHLGAGTSCGDSWLLCHGSLLPMGGPQHLHMTHRFMAILVAAVVIAVTIKPMKAARLAVDDKRRGAVRLFALGAHVLLLVQLLWAHSPLRAISPHPGWLPIWALQHCCLSTYSSCTGPLVQPARRLFESPRRSQPPPPQRRP